MKMLDNFRRVRAQTEALASRVSEAEEAEASAKVDLSIANGGVASLEKALSAAEAEKAEVVKRLTRKGGDYVAVSGRCFLFRVLLESCFLPHTLFRAREEFGIFGRRLASRLVVFSWGVWCGSDLVL